MQKKYNLKLIYDAAHAFGTTLNGRSILSYGDISCVSTHATKNFLIQQKEEVLFQLQKSLMKRLNHLGSLALMKIKNLVRAGINAKNE